MSQPQHSIARQIGEHLLDRRITLSVAESLSGGELSARFASAERSSEWYRDAVVAYSSEVKHSLLDVPSGPVVSEPAVKAMAERVVRLLGSEIGLLVSGVAGPAPQDDQPPGTVWMAVHAGGRTHTRLEHFDGQPRRVVDSTIDCATAWVLQVLNDGT